MRSACMTLPRHSWRGSTFGFIRHWNRNRNSGSRTVLQAYSSRTQTADGALSKTDIYNLTRNWINTLQCSKENSSNHFLSKNAGCGICVWDVDAACMMLCLLMLLSWSTSWCFIWNPSVEEPICKDGASQRTDCTISQQMGCLLFTSYG